MKTFKFGWLVFKKHIWQSCFAFFLGLIVSAISLFLPQISRYFIDYVLNPGAVTSTPQDFLGNLIFSGALGQIGSYSLLVSLSLIFVVIVLLKAALQYGKNVYMNRYGNVFNKNMRGLGIKKLMQINDFSNSGDIYLSLTNDSYALKELFLFVFPQFLDYVIFAVLSLVLVFVTNVYIGIFMLLCLPFYVAIDAKYVKESVKFCNLARDDSAKLSLSVQEGAFAIKDIKSQCFEEKEKEILESHNQKYLESKIGGVKVTNKFKIGFDILRAFFYAGAIALGGYFAIVGVLSVGEFSLVVSYAIMLLDNINNGISKLFQVEELYIDGTLFKNFILKKNCIANNKTKGEVAFMPNIELTKLSIESYGRKVVDKISASIPYGKKIGFLASTGEGKSLLARTILRLEESSGGGIFINGTDYKELNTDSIRGQFAVVPQKPFLFTDSVYNNITMFNAFGDEEKYFKIIKMLGLTKFLNTLENGSECQLKENGAGVPNQEQQLISIARALYNDKRILLLDSCFERFEFEDAKNLVSKIFEFAKDKTIIIFSSSADMLCLCDEVCVLQNGKFVQKGSPSDLKNTDGIFKEGLINGEVDEK
ncbi:MAG: ABC transporter ATP-binding protein [Clostridia bacterium]